MEGVYIRWVPRSSLVRRAARLEWNMRGRLSWDWMDPTSAGFDAGCSVGLDLTWLLERGRTYPASPPFRGTVNISICHSHRNYNKGQ